MAPQLGGGRARHGCDAPASRPVARDGPASPGALDLRAYGVTAAVTPVTLSLFPGRREAVTGYRLQVARGRRFALYRAGRGGVVGR